MFINIVEFVSYLNKMIIEKQFREPQKNAKLDNSQFPQPTLKSSGCWKCMLCGRDKFTRKSPHKCKGGFRKRKIAW